MKRSLPRLDMFEEPGRRTKRRNDVINSFRLGHGRTLPMGVSKRQALVNRRTRRPLIANDLQLMTRATLEGVSLPSMMDEYAAPYLASGNSRRCWKDWSARFDGDAMFAAHDDCRFESR